MFFRIFKPVLYQGRELFMSDFNDIGISRELDLPRIKKLLSIGLFFSVIVFLSDWLLGYGTDDPNASGMVQKLLSSCVDIADWRIILSGVLGLLGITIEGLSYFGIYRLIVCRSPKLAHDYRTGIIGYIAFGACGIHVPCCAIAYIYKHLYAIDTSLALETATGFVKYFMMPATILFTIFTGLFSVVHIIAFAKGMTPLPKICWIFCLPFGMVLAMIPSIFGNAAWINALSTAWISVGNLWMFGGLLYHVKKLMAVS